MLIIFRTFKIYHYNIFYVTFIVFLVNISFSMNNSVLKIILISFTTSSLLADPRATSSISLYICSVETSFLTIKNLQNRFKWTPLWSLKYSSTSSNLITSNYETPIKLHPFGTLILNGLIFQPTHKFFKFVQPEKSNSSFAPKSKRTCLISNFWTLFMLSYSNNFSYRFPTQSIVI